MIDAKTKRELQWILNKMLAVDETLSVAAALETIPHVKKDLNNAEATNRVAIARLERIISNG